MFWVERKSSVDKKPWIAVVARDPELACWTVAHRRFEVDLRGVAPNQHMGVSSMLDTFPASTGGGINQLIEMNPLIVQEIRERHLFCTVGGQPTHGACTSTVDRSDELFSSTL